MGIPFSSTITHLSTKILLQNLLFFPPRVIIGYYLAPQCLSVAPGAGGVSERLTALSLPE